MVAPTNMRSLIFAKICDATAPFEASTKEQLQARYDGWTAARKEASTRLSEFELSAFDTMLQVGKKYLLGPRRRAIEVWSATVDRLAAQQLKDIKEFEKERAKDNQSATNSE